jgi:hypothetical protein
MKLTSISMLLISALSLLPLHVSAEEKTIDQNTLEAIALLKKFAGELKHVLKASMKSGGPISALEVCNLQAMPIAQKNSISSGWDIGRTSLKVRNVSNTANEWERNTLHQFEKRKASGESLKTMEHGELVKEGGKSIYRYIKPIPTADVCMKCHGVTLGDELSNKIQLLYPNDQATGFNIGDIRGAFTLHKEITSSGAE